MKYTLDTNILINMGRWYPREFFASLWSHMESAAAVGDICVCEVVTSELEMGDDDLVAWVKGLDGFVCETTDAELTVVKEIAERHPGWVQGKKNYGDPFVIAHARTDRVTIVTEERRKGLGTKDENQRIPNIAEEHGVPCIRFFEFLRAQGWRF